MSSRHFSPVQFWEEGGGQSFFLLLELQHISAEKGESDLIIQKLRHTRATMTVYGEMVHFQAQKHLDRIICDASTFYACIRLE